VGDLYRWEGPVESGSVAGKFDMQTTGAHYVTLSVLAILE
jgi:hypothetical protein